MRNPTACRLIRLIALSLIFWASQASLSVAQLPQIRMDWIFPNGLQFGTTSDIQISGADLEGISGLQFSHKGLSAKPAKDGRWSVSASPGMQSGLYSVQAKGNWGISNPLPILVGPIPETRETEPNETSPQALKWPVTVNGQIQSAADVDNFSFSASKGERIVIEVCADSVESPLDATLRIYGPNGSQIAESQDTITYDPHLELIIPADGIYTIQLFDSIYGGSQAHIYRLSIHGGPVVDSTMPAAANAAGTTALQLLGRGLGSRPDLAFPKMYGFAEESVSQLFDTKSADQPNTALGPYSNADASGRFWLSRLRDLNLVAPKPLAIAIEPIQIEIESNDKPDQAQQLVPPFDMTGLIQRPGDIDYFQFTAKKGETWVLETVAERQNSPANPMVAIERRNKDKSTTVIGELSDQGSNNFGPIFEKNNRDTKLQWNAPDDGDYLLRLVNSNSRDGNAAYFYRLIMRRLRPDFQLIAMPAGATGPTSVICIKGGRSLVTVLINRIDGFDAAVRVTAIDLPDGLKCYPGTIPQGQFQTTLVIEASQTAATADFPLKLRGETSWADRKDATDWLPGQTSTVAFTSDLPTLGGGLIRALAGPDNQKRGLSRYSENLWIGVRETRVPFQIDPEPLRLFAKRGTTVDLPIQAQRFHGFDAPIALKLENLPGGMEAVAGNIEKGKPAVTLKCKIGANIALGRHTVYISGAAPFGFSKDPAAKEKPNINWNLPSRPVTLLVTP